VPKRGLVFLQNVKPDSSDEFIIKHLFRYIPEIGPVVRIIIELEIFDLRICVLKFFNKNAGNNETRYRIKSKLKSGQVLQIFKACLDAFESKTYNHVLIFSASNDLNSINVEYNKRMSAYLMFLKRYYKDSRKSYIRQGSLYLNTFIQCPGDHIDQFKVFKFYSTFNERVRSQIEEENNQLI